MQPELKMLNGNIDRRKLSLLEKRILTAHEIETRGYAKFLTNAMRKAFLSDAMFYVMLVDSRERHKPDTVENYLEAKINLQELLEL